MEFRGKCYRCNRALSSCMCEHVNPIKTNTEFIILMHPKEHQKTKNGTGYLTHLSLPNSKVFIGIDFTNHAHINALITNTNNQCFILYPGKDSINLNQKELPKSNKHTIIFIIDSTWACSRKMLRLSTNLQQLCKISFDVTSHSKFDIKKQPKEYCLSTIESTFIVLQLLNHQKVENVSNYAIKGFLNPFNKMVAYQLQCANQQQLREENKK